MESGAARAQAYDDLLRLSKGGKIDEDLFKATEQAIYDSKFDAEGLWRGAKDHATAATAEIALNQQSALAMRLEGLFKQVPAAKALMLFPRTGLNALNLSWSYLPGSSLAPITTKARRAFAAVEPGAVKATLLEHGYTEEFIKAADPDVLHTAIKNEYRGRQVMGATVVMGAGMWALEGNMTGSGPKDYAERAAMQRIGWKPYSFKVPGTEEWRSYREWEPFATIMGLVSDVVYESERLDSDYAEQTFLKIGWSIGANITNKQFTAGLQPLVEFLSGDYGAVSRMMAREVDSMMFPSGLRGVLNNALSPALKDVERDFGQYIANRWRFLKPIGDGLKGELDVYTGKGIRYFEPLTAAANALLPMFKTNGGMEPWRQWLIDTGWDGLNEKRVNPMTSGTMDAEQRRWINNWIAENADLEGQITEMMEKDPELKDLQEFNAIRKAGGYSLGDGGGDQVEWKIRRSMTHRKLTMIHDRAFEMAFEKWREKHPDHYNLGASQKAVDSYLQSGFYRAADRQSQTLKKDIEEIRKLQK